MIKFCHYLTKPIITRIIVSLLLENVIIRIDRDFMTLLSRYKFFHYLTKPIITRIIVSLLLENFMMLL